MVVYLYSSSAVTFVSDFPLCTDKEKNTKAVMFLFLLYIRVTLNGSGVCVVLVGHENS